MECGAFYDANRDEAMKPVGEVEFVNGVAAQGASGLYGEYPSLKADKLVEGDLQFNNDFRGLYSTILERWMGLDAKPIVGGSFEQMDFL